MSRLNTCAKALTEILASSTKVRACIPSSMSSASERDKFFTLVDNRVLCKDIWTQMLGSRRVQSDVRTLNHIRNRRWIRPVVVKKKHMAPRHNPPGVAKGKRLTTMVFHPCGKMLRGSRVSYTKQTMNAEPKRQSTRPLVAKSKRQTRYNTHREFAKGKRLGSHEIQLGRLVWRNLVSEFRAKIVQVRPVFTRQQEIRDTEFLHDCIREGTELLHELQEFDWRWNQWYKQQAPGTLPALQFETDIQHVKVNAYCRRMKTRFHGPE